MGAGAGLAPQPPAADRAAPAFYRPLFEAGVTADFAHPESDLSSTAWSSCPRSTWSATPEPTTWAGSSPTAAPVSFFSGIVDPTDRIRLGGYPAPWRDLLGLRVEEFAPLPEGALVRLDGASGTEDTGGVGCVWQDAIDLLGADPLLSYGDGHLVGRAAATSHPYGRGEAFYLGTLPDRATLRGLVERACRRAGVAFLTDVPPGVEAVRRGDYLFVISHLDHPVDLDVGGKSLDLLAATSSGHRSRSGRVTSWCSPRGTDPGGEATVRSIKDLQNPHLERSRGPTSQPHTHALFRSLTGGPYPQARIRHAGVGATAECRS